MGSGIASLFGRRKPVPKPLPEVATLPGAQKVALPRQTRHYACNPSILAQPDGSFLCIVRGANYNLSEGMHFFYGSRRSKVPDTQSYLMRLTPDLEVRDVEFIEDRHLRAKDHALDGIEDYRLFEWRGAIWVLGTARNSSTNTNVMLMARLDGHRLVDAEFLASPLGAPMEKNWAPLVIGETLHFIYSHHPLRVFRYAEGRFEAVASTDTPALARCSGGSCAMPLPGGGWRSVIHRYDSVKDNRWRVYEHLFVDYAADFTLRRVSRPFRFQHDGVEFCAGLVMGQGSSVLSYGVLDNQALLLRLPDDTVEALF